MEGRSHTPRCKAALYAGRMGQLWAAKTRNDAGMFALEILQKVMRPRTHYHGLFRPRPADCRLNGMKKGLIWRSKLLALTNVNFGIAISSRSLLLFRRPSRMTSLFLESRSVN